MAKELIIGKDKWEILERPGYMGKKRDFLRDFWNDTYGKSNWSIGYEWGSKIIEKTDAISIYEDGYYEFFKTEKKELDWLLSTASDVYDTAPSNVVAKFDYFIQETPNNHIHDVAIRRAVMRLGKEFQGDHLVHVRWTGSEGYRINPGIVPFHLPDMISRCDINDYGGKGIWWKEKTIEDFYQKNKVLLVRK